MNKQRLIILIIAVIGMLAVFMPWFNVPLLGGVNGARGNGWFVFILYAIPVAMSLLNDRTKPLEGGFLYAAIIPGLVSTGIGLWNAFKFNSMMSTEDLADNPFAEALGSAVSLGFGLYLVILAGIAIAVSAYMFREKPAAKE